MATGALLRSGWCRMIAARYENQAQRDEWVLEVYSSNNKGANIKHKIETGMIYG